MKVTVATKGIVTFIFYETSYPKFRWYPRNSNSDRGNDIFACTAQRHQFRFSKLQLYLLLAVGPYDH